jgi:hypothetical protein
MMDFILGIILGMVIGGLLVHVAHEYIDHLLAKDDDDLDKQWFGRKK